MFYLLRIDHLRALNVLPDSRNFGLVSQNSPEKNISGRKKLMALRPPNLLKSRRKQAGNFVFKLLHTMLNGMLKIFSVFKLELSLKGQSYKIFDLWFFHQTETLGPLIHGQKLFCIEI
jgi:hypothetical protein